ncbi:Sulfatase [Planctomycetes bacterium Poly30]|uniref:Sulfatase n=1 Tax=Saltatorellus ferox TaxID=2528018 RepID=A0A518EWP4_9BACT|nr:Sulfatase [Planctomycetes bacterium Poly30]
MNAQVETRRVRGSFDGLRALAWLAALVPVLACGRQPTLEDVQEGRAEVTGQGVLVIAIDGLRWDHTSLAGYDRDTTPFLASLGQRGIVFSDAWTPTPTLVGSHLALLSGSDPSLAQPPSTLPGASGQAAVRPGPAASAGDEAWFVPEDLWLLGQSFLSQGWNTAAFVDHPMIAELRGFSTGFRSFVEFGGDPLEEERAIGVFGVGSRFVRWVNKRPLDENWFAYLHMHDLERVWVPGGGVSSTRGVAEATADWRPRMELDFAVPLGVTEPLFHVLPPSRASSVRGVKMGEYELRYDRGIRALDANLARIIGHTDEFGRADDVTVVIVGSFGVELGEHGLYLQGGLVEEQDLRVPLLIRPSAALWKELGWESDDEGRSAGAGRSIDALASLLDVAPTLVDVFQLPSSGRMLGLSLRSAMAGEPGATRQRLFASAPMPAGAAVVEEHAIMTLYHPDRISTALRDSWGIARPSADLGAGLDRSLVRLRPREEDAGERALRALGPTEEARFRAAQVAWESLLMQERRALHFGGEDSDKPGVAEFRALQQDGSLD